MTMSRGRTLLIFAAMVTLSSGNCAIAEVLAPFQVSIRLNEAYDSMLMLPANVHLCNGVVISGKYILTPASCIYVPGVLISRPINPTMIYIAAGNVTLNGSGGVKRFVVSIIVHEGYKPNFVDNDMAILKLDRSLPFGADIQWIQMDDGKTGKSDCFQILFNHADEPVTTTTTTQYPYSIGKNATILDSWFCDANTVPLTNSNNNNNNITLTRTNEFCLQFAVSNVHLCNTSQPLANNYRRQVVGTSLVCSNKLVGLLTTVNPPANVVHCQQSKRTTAYYAPVAMFIDWIHAEIGFNQSTMTTTTVKNQTSIGAINSQQQQPAAWTPSAASSSIYTNDGATITKGQRPSNLSASTKSDIFIIFLIGCLNYIAYYVYSNWL